MGFFSSSSPKVKVIDPLAGQKTTAANYMTRLLGAGTPDIPTRTVAGMTGTEATAQDLLSRFASTPTAGRTKAIDYIGGLLDESGDITQLPEYRSIISSINAETADAVNQALRRTKLRGADTSSVQQSAIGRELATGRERMLAMLAPLAEGERSRRMSAAGMLSDLLGAEDAATLSRLGAVREYGTLPRMLEQAQSDAEYEAILSRILFPYQQGADVASRILGGSIDTAVQPGDPGVFAQLAPILGKVAGAYTMGKMLR